MESLSDININNAQVQVEEKGEDLPPGFRFHPTDEELVTYYLTNKILDGSFSGRAISDVDLNKCEPWDLPGKAKMGEKEWYFFSMRDRKYPTGLRTNRATEAGYWKTTGKDREIFNSRTCELVGMKKTLVFYKGRAPKGQKTNWVMHEYRLEGKFSYHRLPKNCKDEWVVCRIFQKNAAGKKMSGTSGLIGTSHPYEYVDVATGSPSLPSLLESPSPYNTSTADQDHDHEPTTSECTCGTTSALHVPCFSIDCNATTHAYNLMMHPGSTGFDSEADHLISDITTRMLKPSASPAFCNDPRANLINPLTIPMPVASSNSTRRDNTCLMQNFPLPPQLLFPHIPLSSSSYSSFNASHGGMLRSLFATQSSLLMEPPSSNEKTIGAHEQADFEANGGGIQWGNNTQQQIKEEKGNDIQQISDGQCQSLTRQEMCNQLDPSSSSSAHAPAVDLDSFWSFRENSF